MGVSQSLHTGKHPKNIYHFSHYKHTHKTMQIPVITRKTRPYYAIIRPCFSCKTSTKPSSSQPLSHWASSRGNSSEELKCISGGIWEVLGATNRQIWGFLGRKNLHCKDVLQKKYGKKNMKICRGCRNRTEVPWQNRLKICSQSTKT